MGNLIVIEGLDGTGKATQTTLLCDALTAEGVKNIHLSFPEYDEPTSIFVQKYLNGDFGKNPDDVNAYAASSFFALDRYASYKQKWEQDYQNNVPIIADRYTTSNLIYQLAKLPKSEWDSFIEWEENFEYQQLGLPQPDFVFYLDLPLDVSQTLLTKRYEGKDKRDIHEKDVEFLKRCHESADYMVSKRKWIPIQCNIGDTILPPAAIHENIMYAAILCGAIHLNVY